MFTCHDAGREDGLVALVSREAHFASRWVHHLAIEHFASKTAMYFQAWVPATGRVAGLSSVSCCVACATCQHDAPNGLMLAKAVRSRMPQFAPLLRLCRPGVARCWRILHTLRLPQATTCPSGATLPCRHLLTDDSCCLSCRSTAGHL